jgi:hypothetical protein
LELAFGISSLGESDQQQNESGKNLFIHALFQDDISWDALVFNFDILGERFESLSIGLDNGDGNKTRFSRLNIPDLAGFPRMRTCNNCAPSFKPLGGVSFFIFPPLFNSSLYRLT